MSKLAKIGPWGGNGGDNKDVKKTPKKLLRITVYANSMDSATPSVRGICFSYTSSDGITYDEGPWGTKAGGENKIELKAGEYLTKISGKIGDLWGDTVIKELTFVSNTNKYGPYGGGGTTSFDIPVLNNGSIEGLFGRSGDDLDAIGIYVDP